MSFYIELKEGYKTIRCKVELLSRDTRNEVFKVQKGDQEIIVSSNRPFFRNKLLKHRKPDWRLVSGTMYSSDTSAIAEAIMQHIESKK